MGGGGGSVGVFNQTCKRMLILCLSSSFLVYRRLCYSTLILRSISRVCWDVVIDGRSSDVTDPDIVYVIGTSNDVPQI